jgi:hypothetical protein
MITILVNILFNKQLFILREEKDFYLNSNKLDINNSCEYFIT